MCTGQAYVNQQNRTEQNGTEQNRIPCTTYTATIFPLQAEVRAVRNAAINSVPFPVRSSFDEKAKGYEIKPTQEWHSISVLISNLTSVLSGCNMRKTHRNNLGPFI
jgi:hypothetical protein